MTKKSGTKSSSGVATAPDATAVDRRISEAWLDGLRLFDDAFFKVAMRDNNAAIQKMLRIITGIDDLMVTASRAQEELPNLWGKTCTFDVTARDSKKRRYNIEVQIDSRGAKPKRARYHSSLCDANVKNPGKYLDRLPETYVIFITEKDVLKGGLPIYYIDRYAKNAEFIPFNDEAHIIFVNGAVDNTDTELGRLIHDLKSSTAEGMYIDELKESKDRYKNNGKERKVMSSESDKILRKLKKDARAEGKEEGRAEGIEIGRNETLSNIYSAMRRYGLTDDVINEIGRIGTMSAAAE